MSVSRAPGPALTRMRPEAQLLCLLTRPRDRPGNRERAAALSARAPWSGVVALAERHSVRPQLLRGVDDFELDLPAAERDRLERWRSDHVRRSLAVSASLLDLLASLEAAGVPALTYKGPALAVAAYGDLAAREFVDLDILVRPRDVDAADAALRGAGCTAPEPLAPTDRRRELRSTNERHYDLAGLLVELHWAIVPAYFGVAVPIERLFARARDVKLAGTSVRAFGDEDRLLTIAVHAAKGPFTSLRTICDTAAALAEGNLDGDEVVRWARTGGAGRMLAVALTLAAELQGAELPPPLSEAAAADRAARPLAGRFASAMMGAPVPVAPITREHLALRPGALAKATYAARYLLTPSEADLREVRLPAGSGALHPPIRLARRLGWAARGRGFRRHRP